MYKKNTAKAEKQRRNKLLGHNIVRRETDFNGRKKTEEKNGITILLEFKESSDPNCGHWICRYGDGGSTILSYRGEALV